MGTIVSYIAGILAVISLLYTKQTEEVKWFFEERDHGYVMVDECEFTESSKALHNPDRGFYSVYGFSFSEEQDNAKNVIKYLKKDKKTLALIQINLRHYAQGEISKTGLKRLESFFKSLQKQNKRYILRFLYDWDGNCKETEPEQVEIILNHMQQLEPLFRKYSDMIFIHQGLFIGNWGEMNGTKYGDQLQYLALQLAAVTEEETFLAVRTPAQWRTITGQGEITAEALQKSSMVQRLSLFNDGMMGNSLDCGTYGTKSKTEAGVYSSWLREEELMFQEELCCLVPNGGEVIIENPVNDLETAIQTMRTMHITYLNEDYDKNVLNKWAGSKVTEQGCFYGMDGLTYVERHLGYRLLIADAELDYRFWKDKLYINISMQNVGFAPLYQEPALQVTVYNRTTKEKKCYPVEASLCTLSGGNQRETQLELEGTISLMNYIPGEYEVFFSLNDGRSGEELLLANEQKPQESGYLLGSFEIRKVPEQFVRVESWLKEQGETHMLPKYQHQKKKP